MASCDTYVYDLSSEQETDNVHIFASKQWVSLLDQSQGNYASNVSQIQTDVLTNASTFINMAEAVLLIPLTITITQASVSAGTTTDGVFTPTAANCFNPVDAPCDYAIGLKNSILTIIHQLSVMYNNVNITQNMPYISLWNVFKLMTSMNYTDYSVWSSIGFYPDTLTSVAYSATPTVNGCGTSNNVNLAMSRKVSNTEAGQGGQCNIGFLNRQLYYGFNPANTTAGTFSAQQCSQIYKSYIPTASAPTQTSSGVWQQFIIGQIRLADLHDVFASCPLIKGSYWTIRLGLNNTSFNFSTQQGGTTAGTGNTMWATSVQSAYGGVNPLMVASTNAAGGLFSGGYSLVNGPAATAATNYIASLSVGANCLNSTQNQVAGTSMLQNTMLKQATLTAPTYVFSPDIEMIYIEQGQKTISYTEIFQYTVSNVSKGQTFNNVLTSGIAGLKELVIFPFISSSTNQIGNSTTGQSLFLPQWQSPFDPAGGFSTAPMGSISNFNVQVAGQNFLRMNSMYI